MDAAAFTFAFFKVILMSALYNFIRRIAEILK